MPTMQGYRAIDADGHMWEPPDLYERIATAAMKRAGAVFHSYLGGWTFEDQSTRNWSIVKALREGGVAAALATPDGGRMIRSIDASYAHCPAVSKGPYDPHRNRNVAGAFDAGAVLGYMDEVGFEQSFYYPSFWLHIMGFNRLGAVGADIARVYNDWLASWCAAAPQRLRGVGALSVHDVDAAVKEVRRIARVHGFRAVLVGTCPDGQSWSNARFEPVWAACEQENLAVGMHPMFRPRKPGADISFDERFGPPARWMDEHFRALLLGGVFERHPRLRFAFLEAGCGWAPFTLWRFDEIYWEWRHKPTRNEAAEANASLSLEELDRNVRMAPSDYFRRQCYVAVEKDEPYIRSVADLLGEDRLIFASDFPHGDHNPYEAGEFPALAGRVGNALIKKILWDNPATLYGVQ